MVAVIMMNGSIFPVPVQVPVLGPVLGPDCFLCGQLMGNSGCSWLRKCSMVMTVVSWKRQDWVERGTKVQNRVPLLMYHC